MSSSWKPKRFAQRAEMFLDQRRREAIVAGRHGRVGRENHLRGHAADGLPRADAFDDHPLPHQFERRKRAVPFVQVNDARQDAHGVERAHAADAEQQFLPDADALVTAVQPRGELPVLGAVAVDVGIEQQ